MTAIQRVAVIGTASSAPAWRRASWPAAWTSRPGTRRRTSRTRCTGPSRPTGRRWRRWSSNPMPNPAASTSARRWPTPWGMPISRRRTGQSGSTSSATCSGRWTPPHPPHRRLRPAHPPSGAGGGGERGRHRRRDRSRPRAARGVARPVPEPAPGGRPRQHRRAVRKAAVAGDGAMWGRSRPRRRRPGARPAGGRGHGRGAGRARRQRRGA